jgi:hypothetical protein
MPARIRKLRHDEETRQRIKIAQLVNRLQDHAFGKIPLEASQIKSIEILLRKVLPDLSSVNATVEIESRNNVISDQPLTEEEFEAKYCLPIHGKNAH